MLKVALGFYDHTSALLRDKKSYGKTHFSKSHGNMLQTILIQKRQLSWIDLMKYINSTFSLVQIYVIRSLLQ